MIPDANHFAKQANDHLDKIEEENEQLEALQSTLDFEEVKLRSERSRIDYYFKSKGYHMSMIKNATDGHEDVSKQISMVKEYTRKVNAKKNVIKWLYAKHDLCKKCLSQIQAETQRLLHGN